MLIHTICDHARILESLWSARDLGGLCPRCEFYFHTTLHRGRLIWDFILKYKKVNNKILNLRRCHLEASWSDDWAISPMSTSNCHGDLWPFIEMINSRLSRRLKANNGWTLHTEHLLVSEETLYSFSRVVIWCTLLLTLVDDHIQYLNA